MIIGDVIKNVERQKIGCNLAVDDYISCLNILESDIHTNIISTHEGAREFVFHACEEDTLLVPDMYADLYSFYLFARIDLANGDIGGYTNNMILFNNLMSEYSRYYTRNHMPKAKGKVRWL